MAAVPLLAAAKTQPAVIPAGLRKILGLAPSGASDDSPALPAEVVTAALALIRRDTQISAARRASAPAATATTGTTTKITWAWGTYPVINFNPGTDKLDFGWLKPAQFTVSDATGSTVIAIVGNNHSYTLRDVRISQLQMTNIIARRPETLAKWQALIGNSTPPTLSIADASLNEGNSGASTMGFTVTLSNTSFTPVTVDYATANGAATAGQDYTAGSGTLTFAAGETSKTINVGVLGDTTVEPSETFTVTLSAPTGATLVRAAATGTILDEDVATPPSTDIKWGDTFFAPYVSMSNWPVPDLLQLSQANRASLMTIGFIQADSNGNPSWGGYAALEPNATNSQALAINKSIADFRAAGGDAMVSFGGAVGTSLPQYYLAQNLSAQDLANTYRSLADAYGMTHLDFDIEGAALSDKAAVDLHNRAVRLLQQSRPDLKIWYTLPVSPTGLYADSIYAVESALKAGVKPAGVNVMAMDYGEYAAPTTGPNAQTMGTYVVRSAQSTYSQLSSLYGKYGLTYGWSQLGVTPMLGVNDVTSEVFTLADAQQLEDFARTKGVGMLSMWSLLRDNPGTLGQVSESTSGLGDPAGSFSNVFNDYGTTNVVNYL